MLSPESRKQNQKNSEQIFRFSSFRLWPLYPAWVKMALACFKHAEMQSGTRGVQIFRGKFSAPSLAVRNQ